MRSEKILSVVAMYRNQLNEVGVSPLRINPNRSFADCTKQEILQHACYLCENIKNHVEENGDFKMGKLNRHLSSIQMLLSFAGWYNLDDLMNHNRP